MLDDFALKRGGARPSGAKKALDLGVRGAPLAMRFSANAGPETHAHNGAHAKKLRPAVPVPPFFQKRRLAFFFGG
jgi:hypothetical protein